MDGHHQCQALEMTSLPLRLARLTPIGQSYWYVANLVQNSMFPIIGSLELICLVLEFPKQSERQKRLSTAL